MGTKSFWMTLLSLLWSLSSAAEDVSSYIERAAQTCHALSPQTWCASIADMKLSISSGSFSGCLWKSSVGLLKFVLQHRAVWIKFPNVVALTHWITRKTSSLSQLLCNSSGLTLTAQRRLQKRWLAGGRSVCVCTVHSCGRLRFSVSALHF